MGSGRSRNKYAYQPSDDGNDSSEIDSQATTDSDTEDEARAEMENALVQSALTRIRKAKARGKQDVKLNKGELAALERRRKRLQSEAESAARKKGKSRKRQKEKEQRVAVPLSHFDPSLPPRHIADTSPFINIFSSFSVSTSWLFVALRLSICVNRLQSTSYIRYRKAVFVSEQHSA